MSAPPSAGGARAPTPAHQPDRLESSTLDDNRLLAGLRAGQAGAAAALHRRTHAIIRGTVYRLLGRGDDEAEDLTHLAFIELLKTITSFQGLGSLDGWVRVVASRVVYGHLRRRQLGRNLMSQLPSEALSGRSEVTRREIAFRDTLRRVQRHLSRLNANHSWTFLLHDVCGYNVQEVADMTGVSVAAAKSRLRRGRREVQQRVLSDPELVIAARDLGLAHGAG